MVLREEVSMTSPRSARDLGSERSEYSILSTSIGLHMLISPTSLHHCFFGHCASEARLETILIFLSFEGYLQSASMLCCPSFIEFETCCPVDVKNPQISSIRSRVNVNVVLSCGNRGLSYAVRTLYYFCVVMIFSIIHKYVC